MVRSRESRTNQKKPNRLMYVASAVLVLVAVIMGVSTLNNFGKMKSVQKAIEQAKAGNDATKEMPEVQETNGAVTEVSAEIEKSDGAEIPEEVLAPTVEAELEDETENETEDVQEKMTEKDEDGIYVVEQGDTLAIISRKAYGDVSHVDSICKMNGITDGNLIYIGQKLLLP